MRSVWPMKPPAPIEPTLHRSGQMRGTMGVSKPCSNAACSSSARAGSGRRPASSFARISGESLMSVLIVPVRISSTNMGQFATR